MFRRLVQSGCGFIQKNHIRFSQENPDKRHPLQFSRGKNRLPVIFLTGHGDVPLAVATLKRGAFDFFEKPFNDNELATRIDEAMALDARRRAESASADSLKARLSRLTTRERQIMDLVLAGKYNKVIADELHISMRTVEVHRANLFDKMQVKTAVELANLLKAGR